ncbi:MAG: histidine kinase [Chitinophagaceae bacterium]|nr:histidine kinase [Chitinophagaceae bacterium]
MSLLCANADAQDKEFIFRHLTTENGLVSDRITHILQDRQGYIWIATRSGLQRYDGCRFLTYHADIHNPDALQTDWLNTIFEDSRGRLWIGSDLESPYVFDRATGRFYDFNAHCPDKDNIIAGVWRFLEDGNGDIWVSAKNGFFKLNRRSNQFENYNKLLGIYAGVKKDISFANDKQGNIWYNTSDGIKYYDVREKRVYDKHNNPAGLEIFNIQKGVNDILVDDNNDIWLDIYVSSLLYRFDGQTHHMKSYSFDKNKTSMHGINAFPGIISKGPCGNIVVDLSGAGLAIYHPEKDDFSIISIDNNNPYGLHSSPDWLNVPVLIDREENIWAGSDKGINIFNPARQYFSWYDLHKMDPGRTNRYPSSVSGFLQDPNGDVFVSYYCPDGGILHLDSNLRIKRHYLLEPAGHQSGKDQLWGLYWDNTGSRIWAPNQAGTILQLNTRQERLENVSIHDLAGNINTIRQDKNGDLWIGHWTKGLIRVDHRTGACRAFNNPPDIAHYPLKKVYFICLDEDSLVWVGSDQGLFKFNKIREEFTASYFANEKDSQSISSNIIKAILPYNRDTLLIATGAGIDIFDKKKKTFDVISTRDGLPNNYVQTIALDKHHNIWAGCVGGFCRLNISTHTVTNYDLSDGISHPVFENVPFFPLRDGDFLVSEENGFMRFNPDSVREKTPPTPPSITGVHVFDKEIKADSFINSGRPLTLPYTDNNIRIEFSSLQFAASDKIRYAYLLEGVDKDWVPAGKDQTARYNQLRSGHYLFRVKCTDRDGIVARGTTLLYIYIVPPFWNTWWFYTCIALLTAGGIFTLTKWIHGRRKEKELLRLNYEKKIAVVEMKTLRAQMNPHFIFNSLNSINTFILKNEQENASGYLGKFSQLVRLILDNSRTEWVLLENELKALHLYIELESLRFDKGFTYTIDIDPGVYPSQVVVPPLIIQPYVENAIWHGLSHRQEPGGAIGIRIWKEAHELKMQVTDNGVGRAEAARRGSRNNTLHKSHGMKITAERLAVLNEVFKVNATVTVNDITGTTMTVSGTKVLLTIQYKTHAGINH